MEIELGAELMKCNEAYFKIQEKWGFIATWPADAHKERALPQTKSL